jgi:hypothetical protein
MNIGLRQLMRRLLAPFPRRPRRRYDLITEAMTKPFGGGGGRGPIRAGGVTRERDEPPTAADSADERHHGLTD